MTFFEWSLVSEERKQQIVGSWVTSFSLYFKSKVNSGCPEAGQSEESMLLKDEDWNDLTKQNK